MHSVFHSRTLIAAALLTFSLHASQTHAQEDETRSTDSVPVEQVEPPVAAEQRQLTATFRGQGRYEAKVLAELKADMQGYRGELIVVEAVQPGTSVSAGQTVVLLEAPDLAKQADDARFALDQARQKLAWSKQEGEALAIDRKIALDQQKLALADAEQDWQLWEEVNKPDAYLSEQLSLSASKARLEDEREELRQLEELYKGAKLASQTQDIVLERARRSLGINEKRLGITQRRYDQATNITLPRQERNLRNMLGWQRVQSEVAASRWRTRLEQQQSQIAQAQRSVSEAERAVEKLEQDQESLTIKASQAGVVTQIDLDQGDAVKAGQAIANVIAASPNTVTLTVPASDLRVLRVGDRVAVRSLAFGELTSEGKITAIDYSATASSGNGVVASFGVEVELQDVDPIIRRNMNAIVTAERTLNAGVVVPRSAAQHDAKGHFVWVWENGKYTRRDIILGAGNDEFVQVVHGLKSGEEVRPVK